MSGSGLLSRRNPESSPGPLGCRAQHPHPTLAFWCILSLAFQIPALIASLHEADGWVLEGGTRLRDDGRYALPVPDTLYAGGLDEADRTPKSTGIDWRQPVLTWLEYDPTSWISPLDKQLGASVKPSN